MYLVVGILIFLTVLVIAMVVWYCTCQSTDVQHGPNNVGFDSKIIRDVITRDSYLQRMLMVETINGNNSGLLESTDSNNTKLFGKQDENKPGADFVPLNSVDVTNEDKSSKFESSGDFTLKKMSDGTQLLGRILARYLGGAISQEVASLMEQRNRIIRDYYRSMRDVVCRNGVCVHIIDMSSATAPNSDDTNSEPKSPQLDLSTGLPPLNADSPKKSHIVRPLTSTDTFPPSENILSASVLGKERSGDNGPRKINQGSGIHDTGAGEIRSLDITTITLRKLEGVAREISNNIAAAFYVRDVDYPKLQVPGNKYAKMPVTHYQRLFNLVTMYDKELLNQAKSYAAKQYDISMNCSQSSLEIAHHISEEAITLIRDNSEAGDVSPLESVR